ncbi:alpha/beta fold hydrolase [Microbacterium aurum]
MTDSVLAGALADWLESTLNHPVREETTVVESARIAYRVWDNPSAESTLLLVHGGAAHSHWWDPVAPLLTLSDRVVALDLSGHGDSDWRDSYDLTTWAEEVLGVAAEAAVGPVTLVGHSLGGLVVTRIATRPDPLVAGAIAVDSLIVPQDDRESDSSSFGAPHHRVYPTIDDGIGRFRPVPDQPSYPRIAEHVARLSLRAVDGGWSWKFDRRVFASSPFHASPAGRTIPYAFIRAEQGLVDAAAEGVVATVGGTYLELPRAGHAPMLDQPLALVAAVRALIASWRSGGHG